MPNYVYVKEPGILLDALFLLKLRFNGEAAYSKFRGDPGFDEYEEKYLQLMKSKTDDISDRLLPLFYYNADNEIKTPLLWYMRDNWDVLMEKPSEVIDRFIDMLRDMPKLKEYIFFHYFPKKAVPAFKSTEYIRETILDSDYPVDLKLYLLDFFIAPDREVSFIIQELNKAITIAFQTWESNHPHLDDVALQSVEFNIDAIFAQRELDPGKYSSLYYSYCYVIRKGIFVESDEIKVLVYLGAKADLSVLGVANLESEIDLYQLGRCLYDETRLEILSMLRGREMYCAEIARKLGLKNNSTIYHLSMMHQQNMLKIRQKGKRIFYRINPAYFIALDNIIKPIIEEESIHEIELEKTEY